MSTFDCASLVREDDRGKEGEGEERGDEIDGRLHGPCVSVPTAVSDVVPHPLLREAGRRAVRV